MELWPAGIWVVPEAFLRNSLTKPIQAAPNCRTQKNYHAEQTSPRSQQTPHVFLQFFLMW